MTDVEEEVIELSDVSIEDLIGGSKKLVVFNDDVNSFEYVQQCFVNYLKFSPEQALQCAVLIHKKGQYPVKNGTEEELEPFCTALNDAGLICEIQ